MARANYRDVIAVPDSDGKLNVLDGVEVTLYQTGTTTKVTVYGSGSTDDVTPLSQPMRTDVTGIVNFFVATAGDYEVYFHDTHSPPRITDQRVAWAALSATGIKTSQIDPSGGFDFGYMSAQAQRQFVPLGTVIDWWRPSSSYDAGGGVGSAPPGYAICTGQTLASGAHDFGAFSITLPDLRNKFIIGADILKTDTTASTNGDGTAIPTAQHPNAPGIRGVGGSNATKVKVVGTHRHAVADHSHSVGAHAHSITDVGHSHNVVTVDDGYSQAPSPNNGGWNKVNGRLQVLAYSGGVVGLASNVGGYGGGLFADYSYSGINTTQNSGAFNTGGGSVLRAGPSGAQDGDVNFNTSAEDERPAHVGLLKIMKVRRN